MDSTAIIELVAKVIQQAVILGPTIIKGVEDAKPFAEVIYHALKGDNVTQNQLDQLEVQLADLSAQLQQPLPPEDI